MENYQQRIFIINIFSKRERVFQLVGFFLFLFSWEILSVIIANPILFPSLHDIFFSLISILSTGESYTCIGFTILRIAITIILDLAFALVLGLLAGMYREIEHILLPLENVLRSLPSVAVILIMLIWFKSNITPILVGSLAVFPLLYRSIVDAVKHIEPKFIELSNDFKVPTKTKIRFLYLPHIMIALKTALVSSFGLGVKVVVTSELLSQPKYGIGAALQIAKIQLNTADIFAWAVISLFIIFVSHLTFKVKLL